MKINILIIINLLSMAPLYASSNYSIIFVHLGRALPSHVKYALHQARLFNDETDIYLATNSFTKQDSEDQSIIATDKIKVVYCENLPQSESHKIFLKNSTLDSSKEGFWRKASERFFVLEELITNYDLRHVFHLESDNMLYVCLDEFISIFKTYKTMAAVFDNDIRCIPSFVYINDKNAIKKLTTFIAQRANQGLNDMQIIALFKNVEGRHNIEHLPIICPEYCQYYELKNTLGDRVKDRTRYYHDFQNFLSVFDAAAIGQYLGGTDKIAHGANAPGPGFINESCVFNPAYCSFEWIKDERDRKIPYLIFKGKKYRINNLHIHSKQLDKFQS